MDSVEVRVDVYSRETYSRHQRAILHYFGCRPFDKAARRCTASEIEALVRVQFRTKLILPEIIQVLTRKKIELPSYPLLADLIIEARSHQQRTLCAIIDERLSERQRSGLDDLLEKAPGAGDGTGEAWRYRLTLLKKPYQSTRPAQIRANLADLNAVQTLYLDLKPVLQRLDLSYECIRYYAYSVIKSQIPQVSRQYLLVFLLFVTLYNSLAQELELGRYKH